MSVSYVATNRYTCGYITATAGQYEIARYIGIANYIVTAVSEVLATLHFKRKLCDQYFDFKLITACMGRQQ